MPGPVYVPGAKLPDFKAPPKPVAQPWIRAPDLPNADVATIPPTITHAWRSLWHALGTDLPFHVNHSIASRRALRSFASTHG